MKEGVETKYVGQPTKVTVNPDLRANPDDLFIQRKIAGAEQILATLKEPLTEEQIQLLRRGEVSKNP